MWLYQRQGLPVRVVASLPAWRRVVDPDGAIGWVQANLLSEKRTAMVRGAVAPLRASPEEGARAPWRAEPGVIGLLRQCAGEWCLIDVRGRKGWVRRGMIWGVNPTETVG